MAKVKKGKGKEIAKKMNSIPRYLDGDGNAIFTEGGKITRLQNSVKLHIKIAKQKKARAAIQKKK